MRRHRHRQQLPAVHASGALSDQEFWGLIETLSEPPGAFTSPRTSSRTSRRLPKTSGGCVRAAACTSASDPSRTSATSPRCARRWPSSSTSGARTAACTFCTRRCSSCRPIAATSSRVCSRGRARRSRVDASVEEIFDAVRGRRRRRPSNSREPARSFASGCSPRAGCRCRGRSRVDRPRVQGVLHGRAGDPVLGGRARSTRRPAVLSAADDDQGHDRPAPQLPRDRGRDSGSSRSCSRGT